MRGKGREKVVEGDEFSLRWEYEYQGLRVVNPKSHHHAVTCWELSGANKGN